MPTLDVYRDWLGIKEAARPLNHYQLLRLKNFEDDPAKVREHYRKMNAHVRKFAAGEFAKESQDLLNELAKAMLCLTDQQRKAEYDAACGRTAAAPGRRRSLEEILLAGQVVDQAQLAKARQFAQVVGVEVRDALLQQKLAKPEQVLPAYAESVGLPYLDLEDFHVDPSLATRMPAVLARQHSCAPVLVDERQVLLASPNLIDPNVEEELRLRFGLVVRTVLCTPAAINALLDKFYTKEAAQAEKAAGVTAAPAAARAAAPAATPGAPAAPAGPAQPADKRARLMMAIVGFNLVFAPLCAVLNILFFAKGMLFNVGISLIAGLIGGAVGYVLGGK